ncbi:hypothetical protein HBI79_000030 [Parastagonospora nodorum]|nr:hypothetical protein HBI79_000030 [Parastagonospora nodorum]
MTLIKDDDDLLGTVNSHIKPPLKRRKTKAADSRHAKASRGRTKKDKDSEDSNTSSNVLRPRRRDRAAARAQLAKRKRLGKEAQLKKTRDEEELAKAKKEKEEKEAQERKTQLDSPLNSDDYRLDSSSDIDPKDDSEDKEATTAKDLAREQKERLKALLNTSAAVFFGVSIDNLQNKRTIKLPAYAYILYFKELSSNNGRIFANAIGIGKTRAIVLATEVQNARAEGDATEHNAVNDDDKLCPTKGERTFYCADPLALQFCFFSDSPPENIGRLTKEEAIEMRINTTNAISKALAAANKLVALQSYTILEANTPAVHPKATKHCLAPLAAQFIIVCSFRKVDKHVFRAYNTISVTAQRTIIRKGSPHIEKRAILLPSHITALSGTPIEQGLNKILIFVLLALISLQNRKEHNASEHESSHEYKELISQGAAVAQRFMLKRTLKTRDPCLCLDFLSTVQNAEQQCRDILEKEGLNKSEASRRVIFNCFKMQAIASYPALATLKAAQFKTYSSCKVKRFTSNSVKDLFTNPSKDYFLVREARAITKSSLKFQNLLNLCSKLGLREKFSDESVLVMQGGMTQHEINLKLLAEICVGIIYFNLDSELELKVLGKQDIKTTSRDKL